MQFAAATAIVSLHSLFQKPDKPRVNVRDRQTGRQTDRQSDGANSNQIRLTAFRIQRELLNRICDAQGFKSCTVTANEMALKGGQHIRAKQWLTAKQLNKLS
jgi:hypothetical protein